MIHADRWRWGGGGGRRIVIVPSRSYRIALRIEWAALPMGIGFCISIPAYFHWLTQPGLMRWLAIAQCVCYVAWLVVLGIWRPTHRMLGIRRSDCIYPTFPP